MTGSWANKPTAGPHWIIPTSDHLQPLPTTCVTSERLLQVHMLKTISCSDAVAGENVTRMMAGWTYRAGYPLVSVQNVGPESDGVFALAQVCRGCKKIDDGIAGCAGLAGRWQRVMNYCCGLPCNKPDLLRSEIK